MNQAKERNERFNQKEKEIKKERERNRQNTWKT